MIDTISDILLIGGALGLAFYCWILSRRLKALGRSDEGLGATLKDLGERIEALRRTTDAATEEAASAGTRLAALIEEADRHEGELAVILAGLTDMDDLEAEAAAVERAQARRATDAEPEAEAEPEPPELPEGGLFTTRRMAAGDLR